MWKLCHFSICLIIVVLCAIAVNGAPNPLSIKRVRPIFMTHLDVGYTASAYDVCSQYINEFFPAAIVTSATQKAAGNKQPYIWTSHAWLIQELLDGKVGCGNHNATTAAAVAEAIKAGDITWHAYPFSWYTELSDVATFEASLKISQNLDKAFNLPLKRSASSVDVPGLPRAVIKPMARAGIQAIHVGINGAMTPAAVPSDTPFIWRAPGGEEIIVLAHAYGYDGSFFVDGMETALIYIFRNDNTGPHTPTEVNNAYVQLKTQYPNAEIVAGTLDDYVDELLSGGWRQKLQVVTAEWGDAWAYGMPADPYRVAGFKAVVSSRQEFILSTPPSSLTSDESACLDVQLRRMLKIPEHNWGLSVNSVLADGGYNTKDWTNDVFNKDRSLPQFKALDAEWAAQRQYLEAPSTCALPSRLVDIMSRRRGELVPKMPSFSTQDGWQSLPLDTTSTTLSNGCTLGLTTTGSVSKVVCDNVVWMTGAVGDVTYNTYSINDFNNFGLCHGAPVTICWDFSKPMLAAIDSMHVNWKPVLMQRWLKKNTQGLIVSVVNTSTFDEIARVHYGAPATLIVGYTPRMVSGAGRSSNGGANVVAVELDVEVSWFNKTATRLPEAIYTSFSPDVTGDWTISKIGGGDIVSVYDVIQNGTTRLHSVYDTFQNVPSNGGIAVEVKNLDTALVAPGSMDNLLKYDGIVPTAQEMKGGMHSLIYTNAWGTAFNQWYSDDNKARYVVTFKKM